MLGEVLSLTFGDKFYPTLIFQLSTPLNYKTMIWRVGHWSKKMKTAFLISVLVGTWNKTIITRKKLLEYIILWCLNNTVKNNV